MNGGAFQLVTFSGLHDCLERQMERTIPVESPITSGGTPPFSVPTGWNGIAFSICTRFSFSASAHSHHSHHAWLTYLLLASLYPFMKTWKAKKRGSISCRTDRENEANRKHAKSVSHIIRKLIHHLKLQLFR